MPQRVVILHNAGGSPAMVEPLKERLEFDCKAPFLLGHGVDAAKSESYTVSSVANDIANKVDLNGVTLIGLNYGAVVAMELALRHYFNLKHLVLIEPPVCMEPWLIKELYKHILDLEVMDKESYAREMVTDILKSQDSNYRKIAEKAFVETSQIVQQEIYRELICWDKKYQTSNSIIREPTCLIQTCDPFTKYDNLEKRFDHVILYSFKESGPWATLDVPEKLASIIHEFVRKEE